MATLRRPITSCLECYRRKQKCNRKHPCDQCCARKVPDQCHFGVDLPAAAAEYSQPNGLVDDGVGPSPSGLINQAGYSASPQSSTFLHLRNRNGIHGDDSPGSKESPAAHHRLRASYLDVVARLPPATVIDSLLEYLFHDIHLTILAIDQHCLENLVSEWRRTPIEQYIGARHNSPECELAYLPALLFQIIAQVLHYLPQQHAAAKTLELRNTTDRSRLSATYYLWGTKLKSVLGRRSPTLCSVEYELMAAIWLKDSSRGAEAWYRLSDAVRLAQELSLHCLPHSVVQRPGTSVESNLVQTWNLERRKRIWARLFILDSLMALTLSRPRLINREDASTPPPLDVPYPKDPSRTLPLLSNDSSSLGIRVFLSLANKVHDMLSLSATGAFSRDYSELVVIHNEIYSLRHMLPVKELEYKSSTSACATNRRLEALRLSFVSSINAVLMVLHRPFIASHPASRSASLTAALECLDLQQYIFDLVPRSQSATYGTVFATIESSVFLCGIMTELPPQEPTEELRILQSIIQAISRLSVIKDRSALAESGELVLRQFYHDINASRQFADMGGDWSSAGPHSVIELQRGQLADISIPSPHQPLQDTFQSIFPIGGISDEQFSFLDSLDWSNDDSCRNELEELLPRDEAWGVI